MYFSYNTIYTTCMGENEKYCYIYICYTHNTETWLVRPGLKLGGRKIKTGSKDDSITSVKCLECCEC